MPRNDGGSGGGIVPPPALEFQRIARHFVSLSAPGALGLTDDAAIFSPPPGRELVISADAIVEGVHFLSTDPPETIGRKLLRVNLSDLAAMGATPLHYLMTVSTPRHIDESWFAAFAAGLALDQAEFGISLLGGDTTSTPGPISLSATIIGHVAPGTALRRNGARSGDDLWVTGTIGDGALGLRALRGEIPDPSFHLSNRYQLPRPRLGLSLAGLVTAAMDISDGLVQDAGHLCRAAGLSVTIEAARVPLSLAAREAAQLETCLTGGDDYELLLASPKESAASLQAECARLGIPLTRIGMFSKGDTGVTVLDEAGLAMAFRSQGWSHF